MQPVQPCACRARMPRGHSSDRRLLRSPHLLLSSVTNLWTLSVTVRLAKVSLSDQRWLHARISCDREADRQSKLQDRGVDLITDSRQNNWQIPCRTHSLRVSDAGAWKKKSLTIIRTPRRVRTSRGSSADEQRVERYAAFPSFNAQLRAAMRWHFCPRTTLHPALASRHGVSLRGETVRANERASERRTPRRERSFAKCDSALAA